MPVHEADMKIKFSHHYCKMPPDFSVSRLVKLEMVDLKDLDPVFLQQDTEISAGGYYKLPNKGAYMILWLESSIMNIPWQTIRRWTPSKEEYYRKYIGLLVECEITGR